MVKFDELTRAVIEGEDSDAKTYRSGALVKDN